jgi:hypothetical protein
METTYVIITALQQLSEALEDVQRIQACIRTLSEGYRTIGEDPAARQVFLKDSGYSYRTLNKSYVAPLRRDFALRAQASSLTTAWKAYADHFEGQGFSVSSESLDAGLALARLTRNCLAGSHEAKSLVGLVC